MVTIKEHNIPDNTCVIVSYQNGKNFYTVLWNYNNRNECTFYSPHIGHAINTEGSFRLKDGCKFERYATKKEIQELQNYLNENKIFFKIKQSNQSIEIW